MAVVERAAANQATTSDLELLGRHKPLLRFDRQYDYRLASVLGMVENAGNLLRTARRRGDRAGGR